MLGESFWIWSVLKLYNNIVLQCFDKNAPLLTVLRILGEFS